MTELIDRAHATLGQVLRAYLDGAWRDSASGVAIHKGSDGIVCASWPELARTAAGVAVALRARGLAPGDLVFLALPNSLEFVTTYFGAVLAGCLPCAVPAPAAEGGDLKFSTHVQKTFATFDPALIVVQDEAGPWQAQEPYCAAARLHGTPWAGEALFDAAPDDVLHIQLTSGSTGAPKAAMMTHRNVITNIALTASAGQVRERGMSGLIWLPLFHDMGLISVLTAACSNDDVIVQQPEDFIRNPMGWLQRFSRYRSSVSAVPNFALAYCVRRFRPELMQGVDLSSLTHLVVGAERVHLSTLTDFTRTFAPYGFNPDCFKPCYGIAEATLAVTIPQRHRAGALGKFIRAELHGDGAEPVLSMGLPLRDTVIEVRDADDRVLPEGEVGQIWVSSPCVMPGYYRNPEATAAVLRDGFYASGDLGYLRDGELFVLGRAKEIIILRGRNYLPHDFEQCVARHAQVDVGRVAAIAVADAVQGSEQLVLVVEPEHYGDLGRLNRELQALLRAEFGFGAHVVVFVPRGAIPRTTSRKIQRLQCAEQYRAGTLPLISVPECQPA